MSINDARDLLIYELSSLRSLEQSILADLPNKVRECTSEQCRTLFQRDQQEIPREVRNLDQCFQILGVQPMSVVNHTIEGMVADKQSFMRENPPPELVELYNLDTTAKLEQMEVAAYRSAINTAEHLGEHECARVLRENLRLEEQESRDVDQVFHEVGSRIAGRDRGPGLTM